MMAHWPWVKQVPAQPLWSGTMADWRAILATTSRHQARRLQRTVGVSGYPADVQGAAFFAAIAAPSVDQAVSSAEWALASWEADEAAWFIHVCRA